MNNNTPPKDPDASDRHRNDCWNRIGVWGDASCGELEQQVHCRNCPVFIRAGRSLFSSAPEQRYLNEWTDVLAGERTHVDRHDHCAMLFRVAEEWLALSTSVFREVHESRPVHRIPHRSNQVLLGLVGIRGSLHICVSLRDMLEIEDVDGAHCSLSQKFRSRLLVVAKQADQWVFPVDEVFGMFRFARAAIECAPVTLAKAPRKFSQGILTFKDRKIDLLDEELIFYHLQKQVLG